MSAQHRRPLFAFMAVFVVAILMIASAARSDGFRDLVRERAVDVVAGRVLSLADAPSPVRASEGVRQADESVSPPAPAPSSAQPRERTGEHGKARVSSRGHQASSRAGVQHAPARAKAQPAKSAKALDQAKDKIENKIKNKLKGHDKLKAKAKNKDKAKNKIKNKIKAKAKDKAKAKGKGHGKTKHRP